MRDTTLDGEVTTSLKCPAVRVSEHGQRTYAYRLSQRRKLPAALSLPHAQLYRLIPRTVVSRKDKVKFACVCVCNCVLSDKYRWIYLCFEF